jgi:hypothetical protein
MPSLIRRPSVESLGGRAVEDVYGRHHRLSPEDSRHSPLLEEGPSHPHNRLVTPLDDVVLLRVVRCGVVALNTLVRAEKTIPTKTKYKDLFPSLQSIQGPLQAADQVGVSRIHKASRLAAIDCLSEGAVEKSVLHIELLNRPVMRNNNEEYRAHDGRFHNRPERLTKTTISMAEAEGVVTITKTTISTTVIKTTEVVPILLERHSLATRLRLSSSRRRYNHSHPQLLTNSHLSRARQMAHEDSPWAEGSRKCLQPVHPLINLNLEFGHTKNGTRTTTVCHVHRNDERLPFISLSYSCCFLIYGPYIRFACAVCTSEPAEHWFVTSTVAAIFVKKNCPFFSFGCKNSVLEPMLKEWREKKNFVKYVSSKVLVVVFYNSIAERFSIFIPI